MAINLFFRLVNETEIAVTYQFGNPGQLDRELTIAKAGYAVVAADGELNGLAIRTAGIAISRHRKDGAWPRSGSLQA